MIAEAKTGILVGIHILGAHASELIAEGALAIKKRATVAEIAHPPRSPHPIGGAEGSCARSGKARSA